MAKKRITSSAMPLLWNKSSCCFPKLSLVIMKILATSSRVSLQNPLWPKLIGRSKRKFPSLSLILRDLHRLWRLASMKLLGPAGWPIIRFFVEEQKWPKCLTLSKWRREADIDSSSLVILFPMRRLGARFETAPNGRLMNWSLTRLFEHGTR